MSRARLGFLGTGWIGRHRMQAMLATGEVEAVGVAELDDSAAAEALALAPAAARVSGLAELIALELDGVVIATPSALHAAQAREALQAGVAVFCQKPLARTAAETRAVVDAARVANRLLGVDFSYRHTAAMQAIVPLVRQGALGRVFAADLTFHNAYGPDKPWFYDAAQSGGGCVIDLGVHLVDLALWALDWPEVVEVRSTLLAGGSPLPPGAVEDFAVATLTLASGAVVRLACSWRLSAGQDAVIAAEFYGAEGGATLRNVNGSFYDLAADHLQGTARTVLTASPDDWGGRAAAAWARRLAAGDRFDPEAARLVEVAAVIDRIYGR